MCAFYPPDQGQITSQDCEYTLLWQTCGFCLVQIDDQCDSGRGCVPRIQDAYAARFDQTAERGRTTGDNLAVRYVQLGAIIRNKITAQRHEMQADT